MTNYILEFDLLVNRTVFRNKYKGLTFKCLFDTGAFIPVWCATEELLKSYYPKCKYSNCITKINGFGKEFEYAKIYVIPNFVLSDGKTEIHYLNLPIAVLQRNFSFQMILSYTMFSIANTSIINYSSKSNEIKLKDKIKPHIRIRYTKDICGVSKINKQLLTNNEKQILRKYNAIHILDNILVFNQG